MTESGRPRDSSRVCITDGTVFSILTSCLCGESDRSMAESTRMIFPPQQSVPKISKIDRSKQIEVAASTPESSSSVKTSRTQQRNDTTL